ncbi:MAG TPA: hypothetical protein DCM14_03155 [Clostridiales bacterium UBA8153]|nr:hypothetical protein [Clostridiales bacterium UBA8153]
MTRRKLDLSGEVCPYTLVKALLVLETMESGASVEISVDYPPASSNVPRSLVLYGHEVVSVTVEGPAWVIVVKKGRTGESR